MRTRTRVQCLACLGSLPPVNTLLCDECMKEPAIRSSVFGIFNRPGAVCLYCGRSSVCMTDQRGSAQCSGCAEEHGLITNLVALRDTKEDKDMKLDADILRAQAASLYAEAARLEKIEESRPVEPSEWTDGDDCEHEPIVSFRKTFRDEGKYTYAAIGLPNINGDRFWYVTASRNSYRPMNWRELMDFVGEKNWPTVRVARGEYPEGAY